MATLIRQGGSKMKVNIDVNVIGLENLIETLRGFIKSNQTEEEIKPEDKNESVEHKAEVISDSNEERKDIKNVSLEEVRSVLASKSQGGKQKEVKTLIKKYGAAKLSEISQDKYPELLKEAGKL